MSPAAHRPAGLIVALVAGLCALACGGSAVEGGASQSPESAFRSIGPSRIPTPPAPPGNRAVGSHTERYASGLPRALGTYTVYQQRSVPHGIWTFWSADGSRQGQGRFHLGSPVGCFAIWSHGHRVTGIASDGEIQPGACEPPVHQEADILESAHGGEAQPPVDLTFETFLAPGADLGTESTKYATNDPEMTWSLAGLWRRRFGALRVGGMVGLRGAQYDYFALPVAATAGWGRQLTTWLGIDLRGELGVMVWQARPQLENFAVGKEWFWTPLSAVQAEASWRIAGRLELFAGGRLELALPREVDRTTTFCSFNCGNETDTWSLGGLTPGLVLGLRFLVW